MAHIFTHNGIITIHNKNTGGHRTFKVYTMPDDATFAPGERVLSLLTGPNNEDDYHGFAFVKSDKIIVWKKYRGGDFSKFATMLENPEHYEKLGCEYLWESRCRRCNRTLTTPESIASGIGPVCAKAGAAPSV